MLAYADATQRQPPPAGAGLAGFGPGAVGGGAAVGGRGAGGWQGGAGGGGSDGVGWLPADVSNVADVHRGMVPPTAHSHTPPRPPPPPPQVRQAPSRAFIGP